MSRTILIVDDSAVDRTVLTKLLKKDYLILSASSGNEAIRILERQFKIVSAIIMDIIMPGIDGFETIKKIRENYLFQQIPIIIATGLGDDETREKAIVYGATAFISKPYNPKLLLHTVKNVISLHETAAVANTIRTDKLTGLLTREAFFTECEQLIKRREPGYYVMACMDIENFKSINAQYGTDVGDSVLIHVAKTIEHFVNGFNGRTCRFNADKFAILYPASIKDTDTIRKNHRIVMVPDCIDQQIRIRLGRYTVDDLSLPVSNMYDRAALAADSLKSYYGIYIADYTKEMHDATTRKQQIVSCMESALQNGEFEPWFQPQYNHTTGAMIGAEALVRWNKNGKYITPVEFVPIFENNGFIYKMDQSIWEQVCALLRRWLDEGKSPLPVSVNISRRDLQHDHCVEVLTGIVAKHEIPCDLLRLEVTESALTDSGIIKKVDALIKLGFTVEIDDFGSGYSSLNTLKDVPASILKLDMRFFENTENSQRSGNIVESVVRMAKWLDMAVIAEGVEDKAQADYLKSIGCYYIQGYYYARPMPAEEYEKLQEESAKEPKLSQLKTLETLDNNEFWNPKSMETLIFNSYIGGACIFEYSGGKLEVLRVNDQYVREFGSIIPDGISLKDEKLSALLGENGRKMLRDTIALANESKKEASCELTLSDGEHTEYIYVTMRIIARTTERLLCYCVIRNMTAVRMAEQKRVAAEKLQIESAHKLEVIMGNIHGGVTATVFHGKDDIKILFANDGFYALFGYTREQWEAEVPNPLSPILPEDMEKTIETVVRIVSERGRETYEYRCRKRDGSIMWTQAMNTVIHIDGVDGVVLLGVITDITELHAAQQKEKESADQLRFLNDSAHDILTQPDCDLAINETLRKVLHYFAAERAYVFEYDYAQGVTSNTYEICADGVSSELQNLQNVPLEVSAAWQEAFHKNEFIAISNITELDDGQADLRETLLAQNIRSIIVVPLWRDGELIGFIGVDNPALAISQVQQLLALSDYIAILLTRRDLNRRISRDNDTLTRMIDDMPGGFARLRLYPDGSIKPDYVNEGYCSIAEMSHDEVMRVYRENSLAGIHPDDVPAAQRLIADLIQNGGSRQIRCRLRHGDGDYVWMNIVCRITEGEDGSLFLNSYYTDATERVKEEEQQKALLDNLPFGAALYEYNGSDLKVIHMNRRYWQMVGRNASDEEGIIVMNAIYPDDRKIVFREIELAIREDRTVKCDIRVLCENGEYRPFHITATIVPVDDGKYLLYTAYAPVSDDAISYQEMLPVALSAIMSTSLDMEFVKDKNLRYISVSSSAAAAAGVSDVGGMLGKTDHELFPKEFADRVVDDDLKVLSTGKSIVNESVIVPDLSRSVDSSRYTLTSKFPLFDGSGNVIGVYGISRDITAQREQESQLKMLTDNMPGGLVSYELKDGELYPLYISEGFFRATGYTRENYAEFIAGDPLYLIHRDDRYKIKNMIQEQILARKVGEVLECECRFLLSDGSYHWFSIKGRLVEARGESLILNNVFLDIQKAKTLEFELTRQQQEMSALITSTPGGIFTYSPDTDEISYISENMYEALGYTPEEFKVKFRNRFSELLWHEDRETVLQMITAVIDANSADISGEFRIETKSGHLKWMFGKGHITTDGEGKRWVIAVILDISEQKALEDALRAEQIRLQRIMNAIPGGFAIFRVDRNGVKRIYLSESAFTTLGYESGKNAVSDMANMLGRVHPDDIDALRAAITEAITSGQPFEHSYRQLGFANKEIWINLNAKPVMLDGVLYYYGLYSDITEEKRAVERLHQSEEEYRLAAELGGASICRYNVAESSLYLTQEVKSYFLLPDTLSDIPYGEVKNGSISPETESAYVEFFEAIRRGEKTGSAVYQRRLSMGWRWINANFATVFDADGKPVSAVISYKDVTDERSAMENLQTKADTDPLTGVMNRNAFSEKLDDIVRTSGSGAKHALLMLDIDNFKLLNDTFGHVAGDQALTEFATLIRSVLRREDLVARLGGDEFIAFLRDVPSDELVSKKAQRICNLMHKRYSADVEVSASIGIAISPKDGENFEALYRKADSALYHIKSTGKNDYAFYQEDMTEEHPETIIDRMGAEIERKPSPKRLMLVVDDNEVEHALVANLFMDSFAIDKANDGGAALSRLRHFGSAISVVILDLMMPGMDGFAVLQRMQESAALQHIPVIVVSGAEGQETCIRAIRACATDFVTKPFDPEVLRVRVNAAISKAENEKLRAKNSVLEYQNSENEKLRALLEQHGIDVPG